MLELLKIKRDINWLIDQVKCLVKKKDLDCPLSATEWSPNHSTTLGNPYIVDCFVWFEGHVYKSLINDNQYPPTNDCYWVDLGVGHLLLEEQSDWNATTGRPLIKNKPTKTSDFINDGEDGTHPFITSEDAPIPTLQSVTDEGNTTNNPIFIQNTDNIITANLGADSKGLYVELDNGGTGIDIVDMDAVGITPYIYRSYDPDTNIYTTLTSINELGEITAKKFVKSGGLSTEYLMADGSVSTGILPTLQQVVEIGNTIIVDTDVTKGIDITLSNNSTVYQNGIVVTVPQQTGVYPTYNPAPDAFIAILNGQNPGTLAGSPVGFLADMTGTDNYGFIADLRTGASTSVGSEMRSFDSHTGDLYVGAKYINDVRLDVFKVNNDGDTTAKSFIKIDGTSSEFLMADGSTSTIDAFNPSDYDLDQFTNTNVDPFAHLSDIPTPVDTALVFLDEGNGKGIVRIDRDNAHMGNIGLDALDLSLWEADDYLAPDTGDYGATGEQTFALGYAVKASGYSTFINGAYSNGNGNLSFLNGYHHNETGVNFGNFLTGGGHSITGGAYATIVGQFANVVANDPNDVNNGGNTMFAVGNGRAEGDGTLQSRSTAFQIYKNGTVSAPSLTTTLITADITGKILVTKEYLTDNSNIQDLQSVLDNDNTAYDQEIHLVSSTGNNTLTLDVSTGDGITRAIKVDYSYLGDQASTAVQFTSNGTKNPDEPGTGKTLEVNNTSNGAAIEAYSFNGKSIVTYGDGPVAIESNLGSYGKGLVINSGASSTGNPIEIVKETNTKLSVNQEGEITATKLIKEGGFDYQFLKADGTVDNNVYLTSTDLPATLSLYATTSADPLIGGYTALVRSMVDSRYNTTAVDISTGVITTTNQLVGSLISDVNTIAGHPGIFEITTTGNIRKATGSGSGTADFFFRIYKRDIAGIETFISQSATTTIVPNGGTYTEFNATAIWDDGVFLTTDRIVIKYYANRVSGGSNPTYEFQFGGTSPVRSSAAVPVAVIPNIYLANLVDVENADALDNEVLYWNDTAQLWEHSLVEDLVPSASATQKGLVTTGTQTFAGNKTFTGTIGASNLSGTNTGDNATNTQYSGLAASKQDNILLTTNNTSGAATLIGSTLNIPQYSGATNLGYTASPTNGSVTSSTGNSATVPLADATNAGLLKPAKFTVLENTSGTNTGDQTLSGLGGVASNTTITGATNTKITYDSKGLVTSSTAATTADIADSINKRYVTDANLTVIGNTSGTNTGDQDLSGYAPLVSSNILITTTSSITTDTTGVAGGVSYSQNGRNVMINNGSTIIAINMNASSTPTNFVASYTKLGTTSATIVFSFTGFTTVIAPDLLQITGSPGSTALLTRNGGTVSLLINNLV